MSEDIEALGATAFVWGRLSSHVSKRIVRQAPSLVGGPEAGDAARGVRSGRLGGGERASDKGSAAGSFTLGANGRWQAIWTGRRLSRHYC